LPQKYGFSRRPPSFLSKNCKIRAKKDTDDKRGKGKRGKQKKKETERQGG
jgi:hypothetical protein